MTVGHVHKEVLIAFAYGKKVQKFDATACAWEDDDFPRFLPSEKYRIKPEEKPDIVRFFVASEFTGDANPKLYYSCPVKLKNLGELDSNKVLAHNIKLTFDGVTKKLKAAEFVK